jgi:hypothetical protein
MPISEPGLNPVELRRHSRRPFSAEVVISIENDPQALRGASRDISMGGMFVLTSQLVPEDTTFTATVHPPDLPPLKVRARVVHVRRGEGFGCIFVRLPQTAEILLSRWLGRCGGLPPVSGTITN